jgi:hypothetical protein
MKSILVCLCAVLLLTGCKRSPEEQVEFETKRAANVIKIDEFNQKSLDNPMIVGKTKTGKIVSLANVKFICETCDGRFPDNHYIYIVDGVTSDNYVYSSGKTRTAKVDVVWNDDTLTDQEIVQRDRKEREENQERERIKAKVDKDLKELARLKKEYPDQ